MATVPDIVADMADPQALLTNGKVGTAVKTAVINSIVAKIGAMPSIKPGGAAQLLAGVDGLPIGDTEKQLLTDAVTARLAAVVAPDAAAKSQHAPQKLTNLLSYLTKADWDKILVPNQTVAYRMSIVPCRLSAVGVRNLHEQTVKSAVQLLLYIIMKESAFPKYRIINAWVQQFKDQYVLVKTPYGHGHLVMYPSCPTQMPEPMYTAGYDVDDPPITRQLTDFETLADHIPLRKDSILLTRERAQDGGGVPHMQQALTWGDMLRFRGLGPMQMAQPDDVPPQGFTLLGAATRQPTLPAPSPPRGLPLPDQWQRDFGVPPGGPAPLALGDSPAPLGYRTGRPMIEAMDPAGLAAHIKVPKKEEGEPAPPAKAEPDGVESAEVLEARTFAALQAQSEATKALNRAQKKKPAGASAKPEVGSDESGDDGDEGADAPAVKAKKQAKKPKTVAGAPAKATAPKAAAPAPVVMAKPAAIMLKRPAAVAKLKGVKIELDRKSYRSTTRADFVSKYYHHALRSAKAAGLDGEDAKAHGRKAFRDAASAWDAM